ARLQAALLEQEPAAARARVVAAELLAEFLVAVNDPAAPLDVGLAQDTPCGAWTSPRKQGVSSKWGRPGHLVGGGMTRRADFLEGEGIGRRSCPEGRQRQGGRGSSP